MAVGRPRAREAEQAAPKNSAASYSRIVFALVKMHSKDVLIAECGSALSEINHQLTEFISLGDGRDERTNY